jgi:hypothetical protein
MNFIEFKKPLPLANIAAFSLINKNAYDKDVVSNILFNNSEALIDSYIPAPQIEKWNEEAKSFGLMTIPSPPTALFPDLLKWNNLTCVNIYALGLMNEEFYSQLKSAEKKNILRCAKVQILWTQMKQSNYDFVDPITKIKNNSLYISNEDADKNLAKNFYPVNINIKDFGLILLGKKIKNEKYSFTEFQLKKILSAPLYQVFCEEEKINLCSLITSNKYNIDNLMPFITDTLLMPYLLNKMGISTKYELSNKSFPLLVHEMCNEEDLGKILTNLSSNNKELKEFVINNKNEFSLIWEKLWEKFSSNNNSQNWNNNFLNDPNKIFVALHKIGIDTPTLYEFDKSINFYLSHFLLQKSNDKIMDAFIEKGFYKKEWFENNFDDQKWEELINNKNPTIFYTLRNHLNTSVFDVAPKKYHQDLLKLLVNSCSDFDINFAIKGERFDIELIQSLKKVSKRAHIYISF